MPIPDKDAFDRTADVVRRVEGMPPRGRGHRGTRRYFSNQFYPFELTATLSAGSSAQARLIEWDSEAADFSTVDAEAPTFTVFDDFGGAARGGVVDDRGWFFYTEEDRRVIERLATIAAWIEFTVDDALDDTDPNADVTVTDFHDGRDPTTNADNIAFDLAFQADINAPGIAIRGSDGKYHCININCEGS